MSGTTPTIVRSTNLSSSRLSGERMTWPIASSADQPKRSAAPDRTRRGVDRWGAGGGAGHLGRADRRTRSARGKAALRPNPAGVLKPTSATTSPRRRLDMPLRIAILHRPGGERLRSNASGAPTALGRRGQREAARNALTTAASTTTMGFGPRPEVILEN